MDHPVTAGAANIWNLSVTRRPGRHHRGNAHRAGTTVYQKTADTVVQVTNSGGTSSVAVGDVIQIGAEEVRVSAVAATGASGVWDLTVTRAFNGTTEAAHAPGAAVTQP